MRAGTGVRSIDGDFAHAESNRVGTAREILRARNIWRGAPLPTLQFERNALQGGGGRSRATRSWWNGRHNGFRSRRRKTWEFKSLRAHQLSSWRNGRRGGFKSRCPCGVQVQVLPGTPIRGRGGTAHAVGLIPASCRFESCRPHQFALPSPSGKGIWLTPRHSAVRVRQGAPLTCR